MRLVIKGIRSESLTDTLAAAGHTPNPGDAIILQVSGGKAIGAAPYSDAALVEAAQLTDGAKLKVFRAESISLDGKGPIYRNVTKEYAPQIAKTEGKNIAAAAGKEGVGGELEKHTTRWLTEDTREAQNPDKALELATRFLNKMDPLWENAEKIKPIKGYQDIVCHGDKTGFSYLDLDGNELYMTPREFADILKNSPVYEGRPIRLISCEAGANGSFTAQYVANQLGVPVLAPTDRVYVYPDGIMKVGKYDTGRWILFYPREK